MVGEHWSQKTVIVTDSPRCIFDSVEGLGKEKGKRC